jgi:hypothetical protein
MERGRITRTVDCCPKKEAGRLRAANMQAGPRPSLAVLSSPPPPSAYNPFVLARSQRRLDLAPPPPPPFWTRFCEDRALSTPAELRPTGCRLLYPVDG